MDSWIGVAAHELEGLTVTGISVAKKAFDDRTRGVRRGGVESGLLKTGIEGGGSLMS